jgi:hypothetical protein
MRVWVLALTVAGCGFASSVGNDAAGPGTPIDGAVTAIDAAPGPGPGSDAASVDGKPEPLCVGTFVRVCVDPPLAAVTLSTQRIDTASSSMCATYTSTPMIDACVIAGAPIAIASGTTVTVVGPRPLILLSTSDITISGTLDAASHLDRTGPAADTGPCATNFINPTTNGSGGGWGGSFGGPGGNGGNSAGIGGGAPSPVNVTALTGGCAGGNGADNDALGGRGGDGGHSGGAVLLVAAHAVAIDGVVNASGRGGSPGDGGDGTGGGGGGGGSGGMIVLDAASVAVTGACFANGGGGGEGGNSVTGHNGSESPAPNMVGAGGTGGNSTGGTGGASAYGTTSASPGVNGFHGGPVTGDGGGGGAGGGAGVIKVVAPDQRGTGDKNLVAPPPR